MAAVKIRVFGADGKYRGGLFKDYLDREHRWMGSPKPNLQEVLVCDGPVDTGSYYLLELVTPRRVSGHESNDSLFDELSRCCSRTPPQALLWFSQQAFGPPPALLARVARFSEDWAVFCASASARSLMGRVSERSIDSDDPSMTTEVQHDLNLLERLHLVVRGESGGKEFFCGASEVGDMGVDGYIEWMNGHISRVSHLITGDAKDGSPPRARSNPTGAAASRPDRSTRTASAPGTVKPRPTPEAIDATARAILLDAIKAAKESGQAYFPSRRDVAKAVARALKYKIEVASLFGTKQTSRGRGHRYPTFIQLWQQAQTASEEARQRPSRPPVAHRRSRRE